MPKSCKKSPCNHKRHVMGNLGQSILEENIGNLTVFELWRRQIAFILQYGVMHISRLSLMLITKRLLELYSFAVLLLLLPKWNAKTRHTHKMTLFFAIAGWLAGWLARLRTPHFIILRPNMADIIIWNHHDKLYFATNPTWWGLNTTYFLLYRPFTARDMFLCKSFLEGIDLHSLLEIQGATSGAWQRGLTTRRMRLSCDFLRFWSILV